MHDVGEFEASFVANIGDFSRLDRRFRIALEVWAELPTYADYGFAVFKLKGFHSRPKKKGIINWIANRFTPFSPASRAKETKFHPTALAFPR